MVITFVNMVDPYNITCSQTPLGLVSLYAIAEKNHIEAEICDLDYMYFKNKIKRHRKFEANLKEITKEILKNRTKIVSIYSMCNTYYMAILTGKMIKQISPATILVLAGPHATLVAEETLKEISFVDYVGMGEGERTLVQNIEGMLSNKTDLLDGMAYREQSSKIIVKWDRKRRIDINQLGFIDVWKFNNPKDFDYVVSIEGGRGCPFHCSFCSTQRFWGNVFQVKSIDNIMEEIEYYHNNYNITDFSIQHDLFTFKREYVMKFCEALNKLNIPNINWACSSRIDVIDHELLEAMSESGCGNIFFGIETGSAKMQKMIHKNLKLDKVTDLVKKMVELKMGGTFSFIYDFPNESEDDLNHTLGLIHQIKKINMSDSSIKMIINLASLSFLPGTEISNEYYDRLVYNRIGGMAYYKEKGVETSIEELLKNHKSIFLHCYNIPENLSLEKKCLGFFYMTLFNDLYVVCNNEIEELFNQYENNYLLLYREIYCKAEKELINLCNYVYCTYDINNNVMQKKFKRILNKVNKKIPALHQKFKSTF